MHIYAAVRREATASGIYINIWDWSSAGMSVFGHDRCCAAPFSIWSFSSGQERQEGGTTSVGVQESQD